MPSVLGLGHEGIGTAAEIDEVDQGEVCLDLGPAEPQVVLDVLPGDQRGPLRVHEIVEERDGAGEMFRGYGLCVVGRRFRGEGARCSGAAGARGVGSLGAEAILSGGRQRLFGWALVSLAHPVEVLEQPRAQLGGIDQLAATAQPDHPGEEHVGVGVGDVEPGAGVVISRERLHVRREPLDEPGQVVAHAYGGGTA